MTLKKNWSTTYAATIMTKYLDPDSFPFKSWSYPQAFMLWGMVKLWEYTGDKKYYDYIWKYVERHVDQDGNISDFTGDYLDDIMTGSILVWAFKETGITKYKLACDKIRRVFDTYPRTSDGGFWHARTTPFEMWVDGLFMGQMFLTKYGKYVGDSNYCFNEAAKQLILFDKHCRKGDTGLLCHAWSEDKNPIWADPVSGCSPEVWSEGLGWYALILSETLEVFPVNHPERDKLVKQYKDLLTALKNTQDAEAGLWYQVVDKGYMPDNWLDTSGSAMFTYSIQKGIELGFVSSEEFRIVVEKGYKGIITKVKIGSNGLLDVYDACDGLCVQKSYDYYVNHKKAVNAQEAVAAFLWATGIVEKPGK